MEINICKKLCSQTNINFECKKYKYENSCGTEAILKFNNNFLEEVSNIDGLVSDSTDSDFDNADNIDYKSNNLSKFVLNKKIKMKDQITDNISNIKRKYTETFNSSFNSSIMNSNKLIINLKPMNEESSKELPLETPQNNKLNSNKQKLFKSRGSILQSVYTNKESNFLDSINKTNQFNKNNRTKTSFRNSTRNLSSLHRHSLGAFINTSQKLSPVKDNLNYNVKRHHSLKKKHITNLMNPFKERKDASLSKLEIKELKDYLTNRKNNKDKFKKTEPNGIDSI